MKKGLLKSLFPATKILAIHFKYLGDAAIVTPALRAIKEHYPHCALHVLTAAEFAPIYQYLPWLDKVWRVPRSRGRARLKETWPIIRALRRERFDRSVDFVGNDRGAILSLLCGARQRLGPTAAGGFFGRRFCYTERIHERSLDPTWVQRHLQVLAVWGVQAPRSLEMEVRADPKLDQFAEQLLPDKKIVCHLATGQAKKDWPIAHWAGFHQLASAAGLELVFMTGNSARERLLLEALRKSAPGISVLPVLPDVAALLAVLKRGRLFISGDTGPFHCAAGLGVPVIGLFGTDNSLAHAAPLYRSEQVIRGGPCTCDGHSDTCYSSQPCMAAISADDLLRRVQQVLASVRSAALAKPEATVDPHPLSPFATNQRNVQLPGPKPVTSSRSRLLVNRLTHLFYRFIAHEKFLVADCPKYGLKFKFFIRDGVGRDIYYKYGVYAEDFITEHLLKDLDLKAGDLVIDIGSNIGWYSLVLSARARPTVLSFEPDPLNFSLLEHNIQINGRQNIRSFNLAVDKEESVKTLYLYKSYNLGRHSFIPHEKSTGSVEVKTVVLDKFLQELGLEGKPVKFLKIDIEGYEYAALLGAEKTLQNTSVVLSEFSPSAMKTIEQDPMDLVRYLQNLGFTPAHFEQSGLSACDFESMIKSQNVFNLLWRRL